MSHLIIYRRIKKILPPDLLAKYDHLSYGEMAECPELAPWAEDLRQAEDEWSVSEPESFA